jgi:hypothetical protein
MRGLLPLHRIFLNSNILLLNIFTVNPFYQFKTIDSPYGGFITTGTDMAKFMQGILLGASEILKKDTFDLMLQHHFPVDESMPRIAYGFHEGVWNGVRVLGHNGDMEGFHSALWVIPEKQIGIFINGNSDSMSQLRSKLYVQMMSKLFGERQEHIDTEPQSKDLLHKLAGTYRYDRYSHKTFGKLNLLVDIKDLGIRVTKDGALATNIGIGDAFFKMGSVFKDSKGNVMKFDAEGKSLHFYSLETGSITLNKISWYETASYHLYFLLGSVLVFFILAVKEAVSLLRKKSGSRWLSRLFLIINILHISFVLGLALILSNTFVFNFGVPLAFNILLLIPLCTLAIFITCVYVIVNVWRGYTKSKYVLLMTFAFYGLFYLVLNYWNLIGYHT